MDGSLNSTMVQFKHKKTGEITGVLDGMSQFHYGSIQMLALLLLEIPQYISSQFHYGSIQISKSSIAMEVV